MSHLLKDPQIPLAQEYQFAPLQKHYPEKVYILHLAGLHLILTNNDLHTYHLSTTDNVQ